VQQLKSVLIVESMVTLSEIADMSRHKCNILNVEREATLLKIAGIREIAEGS